VQSLILIDNGTKMKVAIWDRPEIDESVVGKVAIMKATQNPKNKKWSGLKIEWNEERKEKSIRVRLTAEITIGGEPVASIDVDDAPPADPDPETSTATPAQGEGDQGGDPGEGEGEATQHPPQPPQDPKVVQKKAAVKAAKEVGRFGNAYKLCLYRATLVAQWHAARFPDAPRIPGEAIKDIATTFFIEGRKRLLFEEMPDNTDISELLPSLNVEEQGGK